MSGRPVNTQPQPRPTTIGRRGAARLRLAIPARFMATHSMRACILLDLSRTGARVALGSAPLRVGEAGYLIVTQFELFASVVRAAPGFDGGINGLVFEEPLTDQQVLAIRHHAETYEASERDSLREQVRRWVTGEP